ncbi:hypothetical protein SGLAM104S_00941 [Streptomyces glaucescens]
MLVREGEWGVRDFDPAAGARRRFRGIAATPYDPRWSVPGRFTPYADERTVRVENADGRRRGLGLGGQLAFTLDGRAHTLQVSVEGDGSLWAVFADATSGNGSYRFRFLRPAAPGPDGRTTVDFNRSQLPPCASPTTSSAPSRRRGTPWTWPWRRGSGGSPTSRQRRFGDRSDSWFKS